MSIDIRWFGLIEKYLIDGDISKIEVLVREGGVPAMFGNQFADILIGSKHPPSPQQANILKRIEKYRLTLSMFKQFRKKGSIYYEAYHSYGIGQDPKKVFTMQLLAIYLYPSYDREGARNEIYKFIKKHKLPKLQD
jgi:hypothetical protein